MNKEQKWQEDLNKEQKGCRERTITLQEVKEEVARVVATYLKNGGKKKYLKYLRVRNGWNETFPQAYNGKPYFTEYTAILNAKGEIKRILFNRLPCSWGKNIADDGELAIEYKDLLKVYELNENSDLRGMAVVALEKFLFSGKL